MNERYYLDWRIRNAYSDSAYRSQLRRLEAKHARAVRRINRRYYLSTAAVIVATVVGAVILLFDPQLVGITGH